MQLNVRNKTLHVRSQLLISRAPVSGVALKRFSRNSRSKRGPVEEFDTFVVSLHNSLGFVETSLCEFLSLPLARSFHIVPGWFSAVRRIKQDRSFINATSPTRPYSSPLQHSIHTKFFLVLLHDGSRISHLSPSNSCTITDRRVDVAAQNSRSYDLLRHFFVNPRVTAATNFDGEAQRSEPERSTNKFTADVAATKWSGIGAKYRPRTWRQFRRRFQNFYNFTTRVVCDQVNFEDRNVTRSQFY